MKQPIRKDQLKRSLYSAYEKERKILKAISQNLNCQKDFRWKAELKLSDFPKRSSKTQIHKRCVLTGRAHFLVKGYNLSRFMVRSLAQEGFLSGARKACW